MKITQVEKHKGSYYNVYVDENYFATLHAQILVDFDLKAGHSVLPETLEQALYQAQLRRAKERALYLLEYRDHSVRELSQKLLKNYSEPVVEEVLETLLNLLLLDDEKYAEKLAERYLITKQYGAKRALFEMQRKGLDRETAQNALNQLQDEVDPKEQILAYLERKYGRRLDEKNGYQKVVSALMRLGFSYEDCKYAILDYKEDSE